MGWLRDRMMKRAMALMERGRWPPVRRLAVHLVKTDPDDSDARLLEAMALHHLGEPAKVLAAAERAEERLAEPQMHGIAFVAAVAALDLAREDEAVRWARLSAKHPEFAERIRSHPDVSRVYPDPAFQ